LRNYVAKITAIVWKDVAAELRTKEAVSSMFVFALLTIVIFNFALDLTPVNTADVAPGILWVTFTFAGVLGLNRSFLREKDQGCLEGLMMTPVDRSALYFGKLLANWLFITAIEVVALPVFGIFFNLPVLRLPIVPITLLGTLGFVAVGTIFAAMAVNTRLRDVLLPIMPVPHCRAGRDRSRQVHRRCAQRPATKRSKPLVPIDDRLRLTFRRCIHLCCSIHVLEEVGKGAEWQNTFRVTTELRAICTLHFESSGVSFQKMGANHRVQQKSATNFTN